MFRLKLYDLKENKLYDLKENKLCDLKEKLINSNLDQ